MDWNSTAFRYSRRNEDYQHTPALGFADVSGLKNVENRTWPTRYRGPVLIHASQRADDLTSDDIEHRFGVPLPAKLPLGGVVGIAEIVNCVRPHTSKWYAPGHYAFVLTGSRSLPFVKWRGG